MFSKCVDLWHLLSAAEKQAWESAARPLHMTGYAWFISQCLRPNPGIYLPLAGGTMAGAIDMNGHLVTDLPAPVDPGDAARKAYVDAIPGGYTAGCRVYNDAPISIDHGDFTPLTFNQERYDTEGIHDNVFNNSRLTCWTAGKYIISAIVRWEANAVGQRRVAIYLNGTTPIGYHMIGLAGAAEEVMNPTCLYDLSHRDYVEVSVYQNSTVALDVQSVNNFSPEFMMQRVG